MKHASIALVAAFAAACTSQSCSEPTTTGSLGRDTQQNGKPAPIPRDQAGAAATLQTSFEYHDGEDRRTVWLSPDVVAEFAPSDEGRAALQRSDPQAEEVSNAQAGVRLWRVHSADGTERLASDLSRGTQRFSPVLHEGPSTAFPMRSLPGGALVTFAKDWDRARIDTWLSARKLKVESEVVPDANMYLVTTPPGLESLRIANQLHESGEVVSASPNFWQQASTR